MSNFWGSHILFDPSDLEAMFSDEHGLHNFPTFSEEVTPEVQEKVDRIKEVLDFLPPREADFLELYFFKKVTQSGIADLFGVSQPTVCYRIQKATKRLKYVLSMPNYPIEEVEKDVRGALTDEKDIQIMMLMLHKTCQSEVARELNASQGLVRHRFMRNLRTFRKLSGMEQCVEIFDHVSSHFNILKNTNRSKWEDPITYSL